MDNNTTIYRKYRPKDFNSVAGHKNVVEILKKQLDFNKVAQSFLFAGQRGTGKTSIARILAKSVNCENLINGVCCEKCRNCISSNEQKNADIIEMDAASNNGVDEIREIKSGISTLPLNGRYKVYIIDEVHMLTKAAFNALLKTLEEPPKHAIFILATTEYAKIPATIISRCQIFNFKKVDKNSIKERVKFIIKSENFEVEDEVLSELTVLCDGSLRDASNMIEQLLNVSNSKITIEDLKSIFYVAPKNEKIELILNIIKNEPKNIIQYFETAENQGMDFDILTLSLIEIIKEIIEYKFLKSTETLSVLEKNDIVVFEGVDLSILFAIADNLSEAYAKTKGTNINFNYLLISVLKALDKTLGFKTTPTTQNKEIIQDVKKENDINKTPITKIEVKEDTPQNNNENSKFIAKSKNKNVDDSQIKFNLFNQESSTKESLQDINFEVKQEPKEKSPVFFKEELNKKVLAETPISLRFDVEQAISENENKKVYLVSVLEAINLLVNANKTKREENEKILNDIFKVDENNKFVNKDLANELCVLSDFKVIGSSENEILLRSANFKNVQYLLFCLTNDNFLAKIKQVFHGSIIIPINEMLWEDIKFEYKKLKQENNMPTYKKVDFNKYYEEKRKSITKNLISEEKLKAASQLFDLDDIEVEE